ncbi:Fc.00g076040.m01.CDS01 [Cosmosporella sp. VM-42]
MASFKPPFIPGASLQASTTISIPQSDYDSLINIARQYVNLSRNLLRGGVDEETIALLSSNDSRPAQAAPARQTNHPPGYPEPVFPGAVLTKTTSADHKPDLGHQYGTFQTSAQKLEPRSWSNVEPYSKPLYEETSSSMESSIESVTEDSHRFGEDSNSSNPHRGPELERKAKRSILLLELPDAITHADLTSAIRGGQLLDVYLRRRERSASVSFLHAEDAKAFYDHVRKHDLYIKDKRVDVQWSDRQFILAGHVAHKITTGATRNLVIQRCDSNHTEKTIRDDLEHIHNLIVISMEFIRGDCFISTNSVHNAMFARTCMMSRFKYKNSKIEWGADECAGPLTQMPVKRQPAPAVRLAPTTKAPLNPLANRFRLLNLEDIDDDDNGDEGVDFQ